MRHAIVAAVVAVVTASTLFAADIRWNDAGTDFNAGSSWEGGVAPGATDVAVFDNTGPLANPPQLTASASVKGLRTGDGPVVFADPATACTLTLGSDGLANAKGALQIPAGNMALSLGADQTWNMLAPFTMYNAVDGAASLTLNHTGSVFMLGPEAVLTGATNLTIELGNLVITNYAVGQVASNRFNDAADIVMGGGALWFGRNATGTTDDVARLVIANGHSALRNAGLSGGTGNTMLRFTELVRAKGATFDGDNYFMIETPPALVNGIIGGYASRGDGWLTIDGQKRLSGLLSTAYSNSWLTPESTWDATMNIDLLSNTIYTLTGNCSVNTLRMRQAHQTNALDLGGNTLTIEAGGIMGGANFQSMITNGTLTAGAASGYDLCFLSGNVGRRYTLYATIADNGENPVSLVRGGMYTVPDSYTSLQLNVPNTYSGGTYLNALNVTVADDGALGSGPVYLDGTGMLSCPGGRRITITNDFHVRSDDAMLQSSTGSGSDFILSNAVITIDDGVTFRMRAGTYTLNSRVTGGGALRLSSATKIDGDMANDYTGPTYLDSGVTITLGKPNGTDSIPGDLYIESPANAIVRLIESNQIADAALVTFTALVATNRAAATFELFGKSETVGGLVSSSPVSNIFVQNNTGSTRSSLTLSNTVDCSYSGTIRNGDVASAVLTLVKEGPAVQTLAGSNIYTGPTFINAGELRIDGLSMNSAIEINPGGTLSGGGSVAGTVTNHGAIAPGASIGTLTCGSDVYFGDGGTYAWELDPTNSDVLTVGGDLVCLGGGTVKVTTVGAVSPQPERTSTLFQVTGSYTPPAGGWVVSLPLGWTGGIIGQEGGTVFIMGLVPEPAAMACVLLAALFFRRR